MTNEMTLTARNGNVVTLSPKLDSRIVRVVPFYGAVARGAKAAYELANELQAWGIESVTAYSPAEAREMGI